MRWNTWLKLAALVMCASVAVLLVALPSAQNQSGPTIQASPAIEPSPTRVATQYNAHHSSDGPLRIAFSGGSLTHGLYTTTPSATFPALVTSALMADGDVAASIFGAPSEKTSEALSKPLPSDIDLVVVELGTADAFSGDVNQFGASYVSYLDKIRAGSPSAMLLCLGVWANAVRAKPFDKIIAIACDSHNGSFIPLSDLYSTRADIFLAQDSDTWSGGVVPDDLHANDAGNQAVADRILAVLEMP